MIVATSTAQTVDAAFSAPSLEHIAATYGIADHAAARWQQAQHERIALAEKIADAIVFAGQLEPAELDAYQALHDEQVRCRATRTLAAHEVTRAITVTGSPTERGAFE